MGRLEQQVALVTGSDSGIGHATAVEFAREGADVVVNYLEDEHGADQTRKEVEAHGRRAVIVQADHGYEDQVERLFSVAIEEFGHVDILMNNASVDASGVYVADLDFETFQRTIRSNLFGQVLSNCQALRAPPQSQWRRRQDHQRHLDSRGHPQRRWRRL